MGVLHSHAAKIATAAGGTRRPSARRVGGRGVACPKLGAACLHGKVRLGSGHLGLIGVAVHGDKVGGHAVKVEVSVKATPDLPVCSFGPLPKRAGYTSILCRFTSTGGSHMAKRGCVPLSRPVGPWLEKLYRRGVKGRLWPREALISRCLTPRRGLPVQQSRWIRPAAGTPPVASSGVARAVRGFYLSHEVTALAKGNKVVEGERPAVRWRQVHIDSATAQPAHS